MSQKTDKRHCQTKFRPSLTTCRGGVKMVLTGRNTHGKPAVVTVFIDNAFLPGLVADIAAIAYNKKVDAHNLHAKIREAANG
jgi:hypothetical protein